ncbi:hypothetical protein AVEN_10186-1 [Araneus ventricosus]|uniref:HAT C-terminal dimerisation domain-containing protein n=1 Tax=Araneus ventricosus TaxID=182803 RepID=A0A4Y2RVQ3_ARAVE|nr:hypothetical protein AVEN_10186-1 [Araneus ventricosus]
MWFWVLRVMICADLQKISGCRVMRTIAIGRLPIRNLELRYRQFPALEPSNLIETSKTELPKYIFLVENYNDLSADGILAEIPRLRRFLKAAKVPKVVSWLDFLKIRLFTFVTFISHFSIRIFLTLCDSITLWERSFSKLKLIKTYLRSTINRARHSSLFILSIENSITEGIVSDVAISKFAEHYVRKKRF